MGNSGLLVHTQHLHRVGQIQPVFAGGHKTDLGTGLPQHAFVHLIGPRKGLCCMALVIDDPCFLRLRRVDQTDVKPTFGHVKLWSYKL